MPVKKYALSKVARGMRTFLTLEAGVTRDATAPRQDEILRSRETENQERSATQNRELIEARQLLAARERELEELRARLAWQGGDTVTGGIKPDNIVWIFGAGRTGSTWLSSMMSEIKGYALWGEPWVGALFGRYYYHVGEQRHNAPDFILGRNRESWLRSIKNFVLGEARTRFPTLASDEYLIIKEPNGSIGAPLMMAALPESRMILLVRDPRDVVASSIDALGEGGWNLPKGDEQSQRRQEVLSDPLTSAERRAVAFVNQMGKAREAYDAHEGPKVLIRYEELRADTLGTMKRLYSELGISVDEGELVRAVEKHSWENIPEEKKGEGKFYRKATPGGWDEDLTPEQVRIVERITAPLMEKFYS